MCIGNSEKKKKRYNRFDFAYKVVAKVGVLQFTAGTERSI